MLAKLNNCTCGYLQCEQRHLVYWDHGNSLASAKSDRYLMVSVPSFTTLMRSTVDVKERKSHNSVSTCITLEGGAFFQLTFQVQQVENKPCPTSLTNLKSLQQLRSAGGITYYLGY